MIKWADSRPINSFQSTLILHKMKLRNLKLRYLSTIELIEDFHSFNVWILLNYFFVVAKFSVLLQIHFRSRSLLIRPVQFTICTVNFIAKTIWIQRAKAALTSPWVYLKCLICLELFDRKRQEFTRSVVSEFVWRPFKSPLSLRKWKYFDEVYLFSLHYLSFNYHLLS